ncbi:MAG: TonB-dependent receptor, partial [Bacteroidetes bacterium HGW-Bacteroidetes-23]
KQNFTRLLPDFYALYQIKKSESLTYNFALTNNFTDINQLAEGFVFSNYNSLFRGNRTLENSTAITHTLNYRRFNMFNFENIFANLTYRKAIDAVKTQAVFTGVNQFSSPFNSEFADETVSGFANYGRSFLKYYKASLGANLTWSKFNNIQNNVQQSTESINQTYTVRASTNYKTLPNLEIGYSFTVNDYNDNKFYTDRPFAKLDYFFLNSFSFVTEYEFFHYYNKDKTVENEYDFLSASLIYQKTKSSKWEYKISATNILNTSSLNSDSFSQFATSTSQYRVQPRYVIFSLKYNL